MVKGQGPQGISTAAAAVFLQSRQQYRAGHCHAATSLDSEISSSLIALMLVAACTSETSVHNYFTRQYIPEDTSESLDSFT
jgi:hypothetical protein